MQGPHYVLPARRMTHSKREIYKGYTISRDTAGGPETVIVKLRISERFENFAQAKRWIDAQTHNHALQDALREIILDPKVRAFLELESPKALHQAETALRLE
jgi:hypothetical protein